MEDEAVAALEARSTGLPVLARSQTGLTEFVSDGVEGLLSDTDEQMTQAMVRIATDDALRHSITTHNVEVPPVQTWPTVLDIVASAYRQTVG